jgi:hypothetical protein
LKTSLAVKIAGIVLATSAVAGGGIALAAQSGSPIQGDTPRATPTSHNGQGDNCEGNDEDASTSPDSARPSSTNHGDEDAAEPTASRTEEPKAKSSDEGTEQSEGCSENGEDAHGATSTPRNGAEDPEAHPSATNMQHSPEPTRSGGHD